MKIYTKTGDGGETGLFGGGRVPKSNPRVQAYGDIDELNAHLGWAATVLRHLPLEVEIRQLQSDLFTLGADLATAPDASPAAAAKTVRLDETRVKRLESLIDGWEADLNPLKNFILPGGSPGAAALQVCRAVCRRAERSTVHLAASEVVNPAALVYLNRLSDLLFVLARWVNARDRAEEPVWKPREAIPRPRMKPRHPKA
ncbi:MAG: cob(I)yrinic acid a,c-diamide adenosyltransferase [Acidobacteria bacterium]|nr:MAG: cob(I)yrinic acid a,c-diamide adenosyltransferase [Acidobacteriota bacterium]